MPPYEQRRYSEAFKQQVVAEIESGRLSYHGAAVKYGIATGATITNWVRQRGQNHLLPKVVRVESMNERDQIKALLAEKQRLESALAQSQLKIMVLEELIKVTEDKYQVDFKKKSGPTSSERSRGEPA